MWEHAGEDRILRARARGARACTLCTGGSCRIKIKGLGAAPRDAGGTAHRVDYMFQNY
jgi:hypothetical protein